MKFLLALFLAILVVGCANSPRAKALPPQQAALSPRLRALLELPTVPKTEKNLPELLDTGLSDSDIDHFRGLLAALQFPEREGTALGVFPYDLMWCGRMDGDAFGDPSGYNGSTIEWFRLSPKFVLYLKQDRYGVRNRMVIIDAAAEIMTTEEAEHRWPPLPAEKTSPANQTAHPTTL